MLSEAVWLQGQLMADPASQEIQALLLDVSSRVRAAGATLVNV